ncbi:MAG: hypothetical protein DLM72_16265 [Candidatus Nitrosopolaris wilkensis]|nr:MAG: hypothetical protein DLM72_16265 [Candidatus Nitrosopolaris wilkensis]
MAENKTEIDCDLGLICKYLMSIWPQALNVSTRAFFIFFSFGKLNEFWVAFEPRMNYHYFHSLPAETLFHQIVKTDRLDRRAGRF